MGKVTCKVCDGRGYHQDATDISGANKSPCAFCGGTGKRDEDACFAKGTIISTPYGVAKIENLSSGDLVTSWDGKSFRISKIMFVRTHEFSPISRVTLKNDRVLLVTDFHTILTSSGWKKVSDIDSGDCIVGSFGVDVVDKVEREFRCDTTYNLICSRYGNFIADGVISSSFTRFRRLRVFMMNIISFSGAPFFGIKYKLREKST